MRLFVALSLPDDVRADLAAHVRGLPVTDSRQWHITVAFLGEVPAAEPLLPGLAAAAASSAPLRLHLADGGLFRRQQVLWARVGGDVAGLRGLAADVAAACRRAGVELEDRPYRPHVTVAKRQRTVAALAGYQGPEWTARQVELVRSRLGSRAVHEAVARFPLGG